MIELKISVVANGYILIIGTLKYVYQFGQEPGLLNIISSQMNSERNGIIEKQRKGGEN